MFLPDSLNEEVEEDYGVRTYIKARELCLDMKACLVVELHPCDYSLESFKARRSN